MDIMNKRKLPTTGCKSPRYGHLGMWTFSLGPNSPVPGERLIIGIIDQDGKVVRRLEQIMGNCIDHGYVDFFMSHKCRPAVYEMPMVDIDADANIAKVVCPDFRQWMGKEKYLEILGAWVNEHGKTEWAL